MKAPKSIKAKEKDRCIICPCGGQVMVDGKGTKKIPVGLGFAGGNFVVDTWVLTGWVGQCLTCGQEGFFHTRRRLVRQNKNSWLKKKGF